LTVARTLSAGSFIAAGGGAVTVHTGRGRLRGLLLSHAQAAVQTVTIYDNTAASGTVLLRLHLAPELSPWFLMFPEVHAPTFSTGLTVDPGANIDLAVWCVGYS
jgi:hypothetical protein